MSYRAWYVHRDAAKAALSIPATATAEHALLDAAIEGVSRQIDEYLKFPVHPHVATRYYTPNGSGSLYLDAPLQSISALHTDTSGNASYGTTLSSGDYWMTGVGRDFNARSASPPQPSWEIHLRNGSTATFPSGTERGLEIVGTWGHFDERRTSTATVATAVGATDTTLAINGAAGLHPGQALLIGSEQVFINEVTTASGIVVERGVNGTSAVAHSSATAIEVYEYPVIGQAAQFQVGLEFQAHMNTGAYPGESNAGSRVPRGGLHPYTKSMLDYFRTPTLR